MSQLSKFVDELFKHQQECIQVSGIRFQAVSTKRIEETAKEFGLNIAEPKQEF